MTASLEVAVIAASLMFVNLVVATLLVSSATGAVVPFVFTSVATIVAFSTATGATPLFSAGVFTTPLAFTSVAL